MERTRRGVSAVGGPLSSFCPFHESGLPAVASRGLRGRLFDRFPRKTCGRRLRMKCLPPAFTQGTLVLVGQDSPWFELRRKDHARSRFKGRCRIRARRSRPGATDTPQGCECLVDRIQLIGELLAFRLQQTHRVVQINHAWSSPVALVPNGWSFGERASIVADSRSGGWPHGARESSTSQRVYKARSSRSIACVRSSAAVIAAAGCR